MGTTVTSESKRKLLEKLRRGEVARPTADNAVLSRRPSDRPVPLSFQQLQVWLHSQSVPEIPYYNETLVITRHGPLDVPTLERSILEIVRRHEIWRTRFHACGNEPVQIVEAAPTTYAMPVADLRDLPETERNSRASQLAAFDAALPFDLSQAPLFRARLVRFRDDEFRLYFTFHHIVFDGATANHVLLPELVALYDAFAAGKPSPLPEPPFQYGDFAYWQRHVHPPQSWAADLEFWRKQLSGDLPALGLATDRPRPAVETHRGQCERIKFSGDLISPLRAIARSQNTSLYGVLVASFCTLVHRYTGADEMIVGSMSSGRKLLQLESILGFFVNPVPLRIDLSEDPTFSQLVSRVTRTLLDGLDHDTVPFYQVQKELSRSADSSRHPFYQVIFSQQPPFLGNYRGWDATPGDMANGGSKVDLHIMLDERGDEVFGPFVYNSDVYDRESILRLVHHWKELLRSIAHAPDAPISELAILSDGDVGLVLHQGNCKRVSYPRNACLHELIEKQAEKSPEATALQFANQRLSYHNLNVRANQLARSLRKRAVGPDVLVGVHLERSLDMVVALLGVLKAGGAYVPLDPTYPADRLRLMVEDSQLRVVVTEQSLADIWAGQQLELVCIDRDWPRISKEQTENLEAIAKAENLAYVIYTSGSTGRPKGVQIPHRALVNFVHSIQKEPGISKEDRLLAVTTISFDIAGLELYVPLTAGACVVMASREAAMDGEEVSRLLEDENITVMQATPITWRLLVETGWEGKKGLKALCGGEPLPRDLADQLLERVGSLWNMYGPTETTIWSTLDRVERGVPILIGRPIANTEVYILDRHRQLLPTGAVGELFIGGDGLARGYLYRPELTAERFIANPYKAGERIYNTGDLARWREDGGIECLGRVDHQVKIRGYRIELEEIEVVLRKLQGVRDACVIVREDAPGARRLVGYIVPDDGETLNTARLLSQLKATIPGYMIPLLTSIHQLPLTPNGKVDRRALPVPTFEEAAPEDLPEGPRDEVEQLIAGIWIELLGIEKPGIYDNFLDLGGHSLLAIQCVGRLQSQLGVKIKPSELAFQSLGQVAALCKERLQR